MGNMPLEERFMQLLDHLGVRRAHFATNAPYTPSLMAARPAAVASTILIRSNIFDPSPWQDCGDRLLVVYGDATPSVSDMLRPLRTIRGVEEAVLQGYEHFGWSDVAADRTDELELTMRGFLDRVSERDGLPSIQSEPTQGEAAGLMYDMRGSGPPLVLLPLLLAPTQWDALLPRLAESFCVINVAGPYLGAVSLLEERGSTWGYRRLLASVLDEMVLDPDDSILEIGCGSGIVCRWLTERVRAPIVGVDLSPYMVRQAQMLATREELQDRISFRQGNAEDLPFEDASFGSALSVTVMEEVDADRMLAEMVRVTRPGGRIGIVVRATDLPQWLNVSLPQELGARLGQRMAELAAGKVERGCADQSLYRRVRAGGLAEVRTWPQMAAFYPEVDFGVSWGAFMNRLVASLNPEESKQWLDALARPSRCWAHLGTSISLCSWNQSMAE